MNLIISSDTNLKQFKENCLDEFKKIEPNIEFSFDDLLSFPNVFNLYQSIVRNTNNFVTEVKKRWEKDFLYLQDKFYLDKDSNYTLEVAGDLHDKCRSVSIIYDKNNKPRLVYKPRNTSALSMFYFYLQKIDDEFNPPKIVLRESYAWVEYVESSDTTHITDRQLESLGIVLGLAFCTNTSDLIQENFVITKWGNVPIDIEVFCKPRLKNLTGEIEKQASLFATNILPIVGFDETKFCLANTMLDSYSNDREKGSRLIIKGFELSYRWCMKYLKTHIPDNINGRILFRFTRTYTSYLNNMLVPFSGSVESYRNFYIEKLLRFGQDFSDPNLVVNCELNQLIEYDIPSFYYTGDTLSVYNDSYQQTLQILEKTSLECLHEKISQLSERDLNLQCLIIKSSLISSYTNRSRYSVDVLDKQSKFVNDYKFLMTQDSNNGTSYMDSSFYNGIKIFSSENFTSSNLNNDHDKTIFNNFDDPIYKYLEIGKSYYPILINDIEKFIKNDGMPEFDNYFSGKAGILALLCSDKQILNNKNALTLAKFLATHLISKIDIEGNSFKTIFDLPQTGFAYGASGIAFALSLYGKLIDSNYILEAHKLINWEDSYYNNLKGTWIDFRNTKYSGGNNHALCNGSVGALIARMEVLTKENYKERNYNLDPVLQSLRSEKNLGWCHGLSSFYELGLCLRDQGLSCSDKFFNEIEINRLQKRPLLEDLTLFNGWGGTYYLQQKIKSGKNLISPVTFKEYKL